MLEKALGFVYFSALAQKLIRSAPETLFQAVASSENYGDDANKVVQKLEQFRRELEGRESGSVAIVYLLKEHENSTWSLPLQFSVPARVTGDDIELGRDVTLGIGRRQAWTVPELETEAMKEGYAAFVLDDPIARDTPASYAVRAVRNVFKREGVLHDGS